MIEYAKRLEDFPGMPKCEMTTANEFFQRLEKLRDELPVWYGELYLQTHRGTLSTEASGKKNNRRCEMLYQSLEKLGVMSELCGAEPDWDLLRRGWEKILVLQFHDILPGTSIDPEYEDCREIYREVYDIAKQFMDSIDVDAEISIGNGGKVVNTLSWDRDILARFKCPIKAIGDSDVKIVMNGENMPCSVKKTDDQAIITFLAKDVKAMSYKEFSVALEQENMTESVMDVVLNREGINVENDRYQALINHEGCIASLFDKKRKRQVLSGEGNDIRFFLDGPGVEDAWNLYDNYKNRQVSLFEQSDVMLTENNELRTVIHVHRSGQRVQFEQDIIFYHHSNRIDFETCVDWQEENKVMRVYFPTTMNAPYFTSEVGFGAYCRPSVNSTKFEKSKFEVVAHRWVDISENNYGVALLNDSKYGHDVRYNTIGLTLLRSTSFPANYPDKGTHQFTYSLLPHEESWDRAEVVQAGIELNAEKHTVSVIGRGKLIEGLATCNNKNVIIDTVKMAETGNGVMLRLYEANGTGGNAELSFGRKVRSVREVDLVEREIGDVALEENKIRFEVTPYEIRTFIIDFE